MFTDHDHTWLFHPALTGLPSTGWDDLITRLTILRHAQREAALHNRRGGTWRTAPGTGRRATLTLADRALAAILHRRFRLPSRPAAALLGVSYETINKAISDTDPLLTLAGYAPERTTTRIRTLSDLTTYTIRRHNPNHRDQINALILCKPLLAALE